MQCVRLRNWSENAQQELFEAHAQDFLKRATVHLNLLFYCSLRI